MDDRTEKIIKILEETEQDLQKVISQAASDGDYRGVDCARSVAVSVNEICKRILRQLSIPTSRLSISEGISIKPPQKQKKSFQKRAKKTGYPKYEVRGENLIRIGWSKKQKREYNHKVPKSIFEKTVRAMVDISKSGVGPFMAEQIIETLHESEAEIIPSYQIYVVIGLLRESNCVTQVGREGYSVPSNLAEVANDKWNKLCNKVIV